MNASEKLIDSFYRAFQQRDYTAMGECYHPDVHFSDPAFGDLYGDEVRAMWHMLCEQGTDLAVTYGEVSAEADSGSAHWEARYTFARTGRPVHNKIDASFTFQDGTIIRHVDSFGLWRWTRMALGVSGTAIGWTPPAKAKVREFARLRLSRFMDEHPEYTRPDADD